MIETDRPTEYERPVIVDFGEFADLTELHPIGDPLNHPPHGVDPHLTSSVV